MLKVQGLRWGGVALLAALLAVPEPAAAGGRAASTRSDGGVSSRGGSSGGGSSSGGSSSGVSSRSSGGSSGRVAVPRSSGSGERSGGGSAPSSSYSGRSGGGSDDTRVAVPRSGDSGYDVRDRTHGRYNPGRGHDRTVVVGGWWVDPWYYGPHWGLWSSWWWPWRPAYPGYGYYDDYDRYGAREQGYGALDLDLWPEEVEVWVDGERIGTADDFDGFPSFLWLPHGTYDVAFYLPGFKTLARQYSIYSGVIVDVEDRMERGESVHPNDLASTSTVNRDARIQRNREREEAARAREEWRERRDRREPAVDDEDLPVEDGREAVGRLHLRVSPGDASVYLDGNFVGTGREVEQLSAGLVLSPGTHRVEVVRPGYEPEEVSFDSDPGEALELRVDLDED